MAVHPHQCKLGLLCFSYPQQFLGMMTRPFLFVFVAALVSNFADAKCRSGEGAASPLPLFQLHMAFNASEMIYVYYFTFTMVQHWELSQCLYRLVFSTSSLLQHGDYRRERMTLITSRSEPRKKIDCVKHIRHTVLHLEKNVGFLTDDNNH